MKRIYLVILLLTTLLSDVCGQVGQREIKPVIDYSRSPRTYYIANIAIDGIKNYDEYLLLGLSGLNVGQSITIPGEEISNVVKRYWRNGLFSSVAISVDSLVNDSVYLHIQLAQRPRISEINYSGVRKGERDELQEKLGRDIAEIISEAAGTPDVGVKISGCHSCMTARGIKNASSHTETRTYLGTFKTDSDLKKLLD